MKLRQFITYLCFTIFCLFLTGCGGPSEEKIALAQETFTQLTAIHNEVVTAHNEISDNSLDEKLFILADKVTKVEAYNLNEMTDEEIDLLIETMNTLINSYQDYLDVIASIKEKEDAEELTPISLTFKNDSKFIFTSMELFEKNTLASKTNVLESIGEFAPGTSILGVVINRDATSTPWILDLTDSEGTLYSIELPVGEYDLNGCSLSLTYDSELQELKCS